MAATATNLTSGGSTSTPGTTASIAPAGSRVLLVEVAVTKTGAPAPAAGDVAVSGLGLTWQQVQDTGGADLTQEYRVRRRLYWFVAETAGAPTPGALTITYSGAATFQEMAWSVEELSGVVLGANGQDAIGGIGNTSVGTGSTEISVTIIDTPVAGDISMGMAGIEQGGGAPGISSPATAVVLSNVEHTNVRHLIVGYDPDAAMAFTFGPWASSSNGAGAMGLRIVAAEDGGVTGTLAVTEQADSLAAAGTVTPPSFTGTLSVIEQADTLAAAGTVTPPAFTGTLAVVEQDDTLAAAGTVENPGVSGTVAVTEAADSMAAAGVVTVPSVTGTLAVTEASDTLTAAGTVTNEGIAGSLAVTESADTLAASGTFGPGSRFGTVAVTEVADLLVASGLVTIPADAAGFAGAVASLTSSSSLRPSMAPSVRLEPQTVPTAGGVA